MTLILRHHYTAGYVSLSELQDEHEELKAWPYRTLEATAIHSRHRGSKRFEWFIRRDGVFAISLSEHLRVSRATQRILDDRAACRRRL